MDGPSCPVRRRYLLRYFQFCRDPQFREAFMKQPMRIQILSVDLFDDVRK